jgi:hypothetical protein
VASVVVAAAAPAPAAALSSSDICIYKKGRVLCVLVVEHLANRSCYSSSRQQYIRIWEEEVFII